MRFTPVQDPKPYKKPCFELDEGLTQTRGKSIIYMSKVNGKLRACLGGVYETRYLDKTTISRSCALRWDGSDMWYDSSKITFREAVRWLPKLQETLRNFPNIPDGVDTWYEVE